MHSSQSPSICVDVLIWCCVGSHGQLGHGDLSNEEEPRAVEALCGMPMGSVAAGGWHSVCISGKTDYERVVKLYLVIYLWCQFSL